MKVVDVTKDVNTGGLSLWFDCPGCKHFEGGSSYHRIPVIQGRKTTGAWEWNGDEEKPTTNPSVLISFDYGEQREKRVCHFFLRNGVVEFCGDCSHPLAGKKVPLPEFSGW